eukprot:GHVH01007569.1.p1 GENE.GHVH01007569.1~~GHVH01007569.1.p1  ORF type:complete len:771 (+),score=91.04 GHVH01007569.1:58-2370(+)
MTSNPPTDQSDDEVLRSLITKYTNEPSAGLRYTKPGVPITPGHLPLAADTTFATDNGMLLNFAESIEMKADHGNRPVTLLPTCYIMLETFRDISKPCMDFITAIAEPISRPEFVHEFQITVFSLYGAISVGLSVYDILMTLDKFSKNVIDQSIIKTICQTAKCFGKVKLVLKNSKYVIESHSRVHLEEMLVSPVIAGARIKPVIAENRSQIANMVTHGQDNSNSASSNVDFDISAAPVLEDNVLAFDKEDPNAKTTGSKKRKRDSKGTVSVVYGFDVSGDAIQRILESALNDVSRPLVMEYDFRRDKKNPTLHCPLKASTHVRYYQERALRKMFGNGRARSGLIVLPCGAGKTLSGIVAAATIGKSVMVLTSSNVAVDQWKRSFQEFTSIDPAVVISLTSDSKVPLPDPNTACVVCSSYTMISYSGKRSYSANSIMEQIKEREWGLLIFDEVQFAPAPAFRRINDLVRAHAKLGLTATLVREDDLIYDLQWLIGPKLYEANWLELQDAGYLAKVQCCEVWCSMTSEYYRAYLEANPHTRRKLWVLNPNKLRTCEYLIRYHESRKDKVIVFSDSLFALKEVALSLHRPFICGDVTLQERMILIHKFKTSPNFNTIFLSKVGDNAIDIPCANVVIQISFNFASRRQEAQRLGRILRPKPHTNEEFNAFFYSLVSKDTAEISFADRRQQFIIDQGYSYIVIPEKAFPLDKEELIFDDKGKQRSILSRILSSSTIGVIPDYEDGDLPLSDAAIDQKTIIQEVNLMKNASNTTTS